MSQLVWLVLMMVTQVPVTELVRAVAVVAVWETEQSPVLVLSMVEALGLGLVLKTEHSYTIKGISVLPTRRTPIF